MKLVTTKCKSGRLHEKHVVATWNLGNHLSICLWAQGNQEKPVSRWPVAGPSEYWLLASSLGIYSKKMGFGWGTAYFRCRIAVEVVPFLPCVFFNRISFSSIKVRFSGGFGTGKFSLCVQGLISLGKSGYFTECLDLEVIRVTVVKQMIGLWFPPNHGSDERHLQLTICSSCEKSHTRYTTNMRG